jgi:L,D-transpeptidase YcbB
MRFGLIPDGIVGSSTLDVLNVSAKDRLTQILINLERWRQMPHDLGERYVEVNIPDFSLKVVDQGKVVQTMRVIVGRKDRPTPTFIGRMTYLEFNPYWTVPPKIAKKDILPKIQNDPSFLIRKQIRVFENWNATAAELDPLSIDWNALSDEKFPYRLRQEPAVSNALGQIKFMFPNKLNVYLHDTPSKELFLRRQRNFSSGCVRVENPFKLAAYLLNADDNWSPPKLRHILDDESKKPKVILLKKPVPIYLLYWTTWVEDDDSVHFRNDIYGYDQTLFELLKKQPSIIRTCQNDSTVG